MGPKIVVDSSCRAPLFNFEIVNAAVRDQQFESLWGVLQQSLRAGESVLTHCMAGRHRGAGAAAMFMFKSVLQNIRPRQS